MQDKAVFEEDHCVAWVSSRKWLSYNDVTRQGFTECHLMETVSLHVSKIQIFSPQPPTVSPLEVWKVYPAKVIGITEKRVAVGNAMLKPAPKQMLNRPELSQFSIARKPPGKAR